MPLKFRLKLLMGIIEEGNLLCSECNKEVYIKNNILNKTCGDIKCLSNVRSKNAKTYDLSCLYTEEIRLKRINALKGRKFSEETKRKISDSNKKIWTEEYKLKDKLNRIEKNVFEKQSKTMKLKILNGEFTPKSENRKRSKRIKSDITGISYRSNWELIFHEKNQHLKYEKIRIIYKDGDLDRVYITDFVDEDKRIIYEIKPTSELNDINFLNKLKYTKQWCNDNNFEYKVITEKDYDFYGRQIKPK